MQWYSGSQESYITRRDSGSQWARALLSSDPPILHRLLNRLLYMLTYSVFFFLSSPVILLSLSRCSRNLETFYFRLLSFLALFSFPTKRLLQKWGDDARSQKIRNKREPLTTSEALPLLSYPVCNLH